MHEVSSIPCTLLFICHMLVPLTIWETAMSRSPIYCLLLLFMWYVHSIHAPANIQITIGPQNTTAFEGDSVLFGCIYTGTSSSPYWKIAGTTYSTNLLPRGYTSTADGIFIASVETAMNNTQYICFFTVYVGGQFVNLESLPAYLLILESSKLGKLAWKVVIMLNAHNSLFL